MTVKADEKSSDEINTNTRRSTSDNNEVIIMFKPSLVKHAASHLRLPANFVGVRCARQDFKKTTSSSKSADENKGNDNDKGKPARLKTSNDVKFCVVDENGNERRMTKAEKKAKKFQIAQAKKEAKKEQKKRKIEEMTVDDNNNRDNESNETTDSEAVEQEKNSQLKKASATTYHQLPLNPTTIEQELSEFKGKRGNLPPQILSPPMALQFVSKDINSQSPENKTGYHCDEGAILTYDHNLSQEWATRLKKQCVLPSEALRQKEDLRPLAYRLQPEPWQRLRPTIEENPMLTSNRNHDDGNQKSVSSSLTSNETTRSILIDNNLEAHDWVQLTCRPRLIPSMSSPEKIKGMQHDDILSIVFEYIHRQTPFHISCGAKFGSDFLVYDGPRDERHAFAGLRVLSGSTNLMTTASASTQPSPENDPSNPKKLSNGGGIQLPLPSAYSLTGFVRCLNTAGKLALLATVDEVLDCDDGDKKEELASGSLGAKKKRYRVAFVDVALEKVLDVHKRKNRGRSVKKKLQKRRDVTLTLSKR